MSDRNRILQGIGVAVIIISIGALAYSSQSVRNHVASISQPPNTPVATNTTFSGNKQALSPNTIIVKIPSGAGREESVSEFFEPSRINAHTGETVRWIDGDTVSHTITSATFNGIVWPNGSNQGSSVFSHTFDKSGTFSYFCQIHPYMSGVVFVDVQETERVINSTVGPSSHFLNVKIEMPQNTAYMNNYGPYFIPTYALVPSGARVSWENKDFVAHTATASDGSFNTGAVLPGQSYTLAIDHNPGTIAYFCQIHPWMQAMLNLPSSLSPTSFSKR